MGKTKDYEDYIDYTYDHGIDPADYESYDDYIKDVLGEMPPINYDKWERDSKSLLQSELTDFFLEYQQPPDVSYERDIPTRIEGEPTKDKIIVTRSKSISKNIRWQTKRSKGTVSPTTKKQVKSIQTKIVEGKKFSKSERKLYRSSRMSRSWELQKKFGYSRSDAMKRAAKEYDY